MKPNQKIIESIFIKKRKEGWTNVKIAEFFKCNISSVVRYGKKLKVLGLIKEKNKNYLKEKKIPNNNKKQNIDLIYELKKTLPSPRPLEKKIIAHHKEGDTLNIAIGDFHVGRIIKNEYGEIVHDVEKFKKMIGLYTIELFNLLDNYITKNTPIKDVAIISVGDILDGSGIYASQEKAAELSPPFQVMVAMEVIQKIIVSLIKRELHVSFYGVKGNHGEIRVNGKAKDPNANWDLMLYLMINFWAQSMKMSKNLSVYYSELDFLNFINRGWHYHVRHIAPKQTETPSGKSKVLGWNKLHEIDVLVHGHVHHWGAWDRSGIVMIRNGALTAGDEFAETLAEESKPTQMVWGCNEIRPVTFIYPIDLGGGKK